MNDRELSIHRALNHHQAKGTIRTWRVLEPTVRVKGNRRWNVQDHSSEKWMDTREVEAYCAGLAAAQLAAHRKQAELAAACSHPATRMFVNDRSQFECGACHEELGR